MNQRRLTLLFGILLGVFMVSLLPGQPALAVSAGDRDHREAHDDCDAAKGITVMRDQVEWWAREGGASALAAEFWVNPEAELETPARLDWTLVITKLDRTVIDRTTGSTILRDGKGFALVNFEGRTSDGKPLEAGLYVYRYEVPGFESSGGFLRVYASDEQPEPKRNDGYVPDATSLNPSVPYNFYFGTPHSHTIYSDGGIPVATCNGSVSSPHTGAKPADAYAYAKTTGGVDWAAVNEHNHLLDDACGSGCSTATLRALYQDGLNAAAAATTSTFVGLYGMEWGVISGGGHIALYDITKIFGWEAYADVTTPKSDYLTLYTTANNAAYQGPAGAAAGFCHPGTSDFGSFAKNAAGVNVMTGLAVISGPSDSKLTTFADAGSRYSGPKKGGTDMYQYALQRGWKVGPEAHQDNHCWNYGTSTRNRTVVLATSLSRASVVSALKARRFYASSDLNAQMFFGTADYTKVMGQTFTVSTSTVNLLLWVKDPDGATVSSVTLYQGNPAAGSGSPSTVAMTNAGNGTYTATVTLPATGENYFYTYAALSSGAELFSAPMWISRSGGCSDTTAPAASITAPSATTVTGTVTVSATATDNVGVTGMTLKIDGATVATSTSGSVSYSWNTSSLTAGSSHSITVTATDACGNVSPTATKSVTIGSTGCSDTAAPSATITAPTASSVTGTVTVSATGSDNVGVTGMTLKIDGTTVASSTSGSVSYSWNTSSLAAGSSHSITATSTDACGNVSPTATKTVTIGTAPTNPIVNPGFESGVPPTPWVETGSYEQITGTTTSSANTSVSPHGGTKMAYMAGYDSADDYLYQNFTVPNTTSNVNLSFWYRIVTTDGTTTAYDSLYLDVYNSTGTTRLGTLATFSNKNANSGWTQKTALSLNSWKGQTIRLRLHATSDSSNPTDFFVDDFNVTMP